MARQCGADPRRHDWRPAGDGRQCCALCGAERPCKRHLWTAAGDGRESCSRCAAERERPPRCHVLVNLADADYDRLSELAEAAGTSRAAYLRRSALAS